MEVIATVGNNAIIEHTYDYSSFSKEKRFIYDYYYQMIHAWMKGETLLPPPIEINIDPVNTCQQDCIYCNAIHTMTGEYMTEDHLMELGQYIADWTLEGLDPFRAPDKVINLFSPRAVCFAGGGEPTLHPQLGEAIEFYNSLGLEIALITNGLFRNEEQICLIGENCKWIGISIDSGTPETYEKIRKTDSFSRVIQNAATLMTHRPTETMGKAGLDTGQGVTYKYLLLPDNVQDLLQATEMARSVGFNRIHIRPATQHWFREFETDFDLDYVAESIKKCRALETEDFKVEAIFHKFNPEIKVQHKFETCRSTPLMLCLEANGNMNLCIDQKGNPDLILGNHNDLTNIKKLWGSQEHLDRINGIRVASCPKCTFEDYNTYFEHGAIKDRFSRNFT